MKDPVAAALLILLSSASLRAQDEASSAPLPAHLRDRGTGVATSMFGTYVRRGELIIYPFYEY